MEKFFSNRYISSNAEVDLTSAAHLISDIRNQILRIEAEFKKSVPYVISTSVTPELCTTTEDALVISDYSGNIQECVLNSNAINKYKIEGSISTISYSSTYNCLYVSAESLFTINLETKELKVAVNSNVGYFKADGKYAYSILDENVCSWDLGTMKSTNLYQHADGKIIDFNAECVSSLSENLLIVHKGNIIFQYDSFEGRALFTKTSANFIGVCGEFNHILLISLYTWNVKKICQSSYGINYYSIDINEGSGILLGVASSQLIMYDLKIERVPVIFLNSNLKYVLSGFLSDGRIFACSKKSKVYIWEKQQLDDRIIINTPENVKGLLNFGRFFIVYNENHIYYTDSVSLTMTELVLNSSPEIIQAVCCDSDKLIVAQERVINIFSSNLTLFGCRPIEKIFKSIVSNESHYFGVLSEKIEVFSKDFTYLQDINIKRNKISCVITNESCIFIGYFSGIIQVIDSVSFMEIGTMDEHKEQIVSMVFINNKNLLISSAEDSLNKIWSCSSYQCIFSYGSHRCIKIIESKDLNYYFTLRHSCDIDIWDSNDFALHCYLQAESLGLDMCLGDDESHIALLFADKLMLLNNPVKYQKVSAFCGKMGNSNKFKKQIYRFIMGMPLKDPNKLANWVISPYNMNLLCIISFFNKIEYLPLVISQNSLHPTTSGETSISICLAKNYIDSIELILKSLHILVKTNPYCLYYLENTLLELNRKSVPSLNKLYTLAMGKSFIKSLPKFCTNPSSLPITLESTNILPDPLEFMALENYSSLGKAITFTHTFIKINTNLGSSESIKLMESLLQCENRSIFKTPLIKTLLEEKWKKVKLIMLVQALVYVAYIITLALFCTKYYNSGFLIVPFLISKVLLFYEAFQIISGPFNYFKDLWNIVDLIRAGLFLAFSIVFWHDSSPNKELLSIIIFLTWCRGITYFRLFSETRYYINLLFQVIRDMLAFFIIFFYSIVGFALVFFTLSELSDYFPYLTDTYTLNLGSMNTDGYNKLQWLYFLLVTVLNPIVMLNLLISIMSDTYGRVQSELLIEDSLGLCVMIKEIESLLFWRRNLNTRYYIHICDIERPQVGLAGEIKYLKDIKAEIKQVSQVVEERHNYLLRNYDTLKGSMMNANQSLNEFKQLLNNRRF